MADDVEVQPTEGGASVATTSPPVAAAAPAAPAAPESAPESPPNDDVQTQSFQPAQHWAALAEVPILNPLNTAYCELIGIPSSKNWKAATPNPR